MTGPRRITNIHINTLLDSPKRASLSSLPPEIMNQILADVFRDCRISLELSPSNGFGIKRCHIRERIVPIGVLLASRALRKQALPFLQGLHVHVLDGSHGSTGTAPAWSPFPNSEPVHESWVKLLPTSLQSNVTSLAIHVSCIDATLLTVLPNLEQLIVSGCQASMSVPNRRPPSLSDLEILKCLENMFSSRESRRVLRVRLDEPRPRKGKTTLPRPPIKLAFEICLNDLARPSGQRYLSALVSLDSIDPCGRAKTPLIISSA
jgi:hypothetical protein